MTFKQAFQELIDSKDIEEHITPELADKLKEVVAAHTYEISAHITKLRQIMAIVGSELATIRENND